MRHTREEPVRSFVLNEEKQNNLLVFELQRELLFYKLTAISLCTFKKTINMAIFKNTLFKVNICSKTESIYIHSYVFSLLRYQQNLF